MLQMDFGSIKRNVGLFVKRGKYVLQSVKNCCQIGYFPLLSFKT